MAKMKKPSIDFKQFILEKGEKYGFYAAVGFLGVLVLLGGYVASTAASSSAIVRDMDGKVATVQQKTVTGAANPPPFDEVVKKPAKVLNIPFDEAVTSNAFFNVASDEHMKRTNPTILPITEAQAQFIRGSIVALDIIEDAGDGFMVGVLGTKATTKNSSLLINKIKLGIKGNPLPPGGVPMQQIPQGPPPGAGRPGGGGGGKFGGGGMSAGGGGATGAGGGIPTVRAAEAEVQYMKLDSKGLETAKLAENILPKRMVVVTGSVPYKKQLELFASALRANSPMELLAADMPQYRGFVVERQVWSADGKEMQSDWSELNMNETFRPLFVRVLEWEPETYTKDPSVAALFPRVIPDQGTRLLMPRPKLRRGQYEPVSLPSVETALKTLKEQGADADKPKNRVQTKLEETDIFNTGGTTQQGQGGNTTNDVVTPSAGGGRVRITPPTPPTIPGMPGMPFQGPTAASDGSEEVWLMRFIDVSIEPGHQYRYRVALKTANPNYRRNVKELSIPKYADDEELKSAWFELPDPVIVPRDEYLYAASNDRPGRRVTDRLVQDPPDATYLQMQRWADFVRPEKMDRVQPIGDWIVADLRCFRGQLISENIKLKLPLWSMPAATFLFRDPPRMVTGGLFGGKGRLDPVWGVDFTPLPQMLVVDFEGGSGTYNVGRRQVIDQASVDVLLMTDDGKLIVKRSQADMADQERQKREEGWKRWLDQVMADTVQFKLQGTTGTPPPGGGGPQGPGAGPSG